MKPPICILLAFALILVVGRVRAASDSAPTPAIDISKICGPFNSEAYLEVASALQALPEAQRVTQLRAWTKAPGDAHWDCAFDQQVIMLCRLLFEAKSGSALRPPMLGVPALVGYGAISSLMQSDAEIHQRWQLEPITLVDGIPFAIVDFYQTSRTREPALDYLEYCLKEGKWTARSYAPATKEALQAAVDQLLHQSWPKALDPFETKFLSDQIQTYVPLSFSMDIMAGHSREGPGDEYFNLGFQPGNPANAWSDEADPSPGWSMVGILASVSGGQHPYRWQLFRLAPTGSGAKILARGRDKDPNFDPSGKSGFEVPWSGLASGDQLLLLVEDARGKQAYDLLAVTAKNKFKVKPPVADPPASDPLLQQVLSAAKPKK